MRNADRGTRNEHRPPRRALALLFLVVIPGFTPAQEVIVSATHNQQGPLQLSDHVVVTLTVEGPAPLFVELPKPAEPGLPPESALLVEESSRSWGVRFIGKPTKTDLHNGREKWVQGIWLEPFVDGDWLVKFAPLRVNGREVEGPGVALSVEKSKVKDPHDTTGIEKLPPLVPGRTSLAVLWWVAGGLGAAVVALVAWLLRSRPAPITPAAWAAAAFARLDGFVGAALVARVADVLREFVERRFGIPATKFTTPELLAAAEQQAVWSVEETDALRRILDRCDRSKFAGDVPDDDGCRRLLAAGRDWVDQVCAARAGPG